MQVSRLDIAARGEGQPQTEEPERDTESGAQRLLARQIEQVMRGVIAAQRRLDPRPKKQERKKQQRKQHRGPKRRGYRVSPEVERECRPKAQRAFDPTDVPIRLRRARDLPRVIWTPKPDRVDLYERTECDRDHRYREHQRDRLGRVARKER